MTFEAVKEKLHRYIEKADQDKVMAMYTLLMGEIEGSAIAYDNEMLDMLEQRRDNMLSEGETTYTLEQTIENMRKRRNGL
jgi:hypothetical protein